MAEHLLHLLLVNVDKKDVLPALVGYRTARITVLCDVRFEAKLPAEIPRIVVNDIRDLHACKEAVVAFDRHDPIDRVAGVDEKSLWAAAYLRAYFNLPGLNYDESLRYMNKISTKEAWKAAGLPCAGFAPIHGTNEVPGVGKALGWPLILKRRFGAGSQFTYRIDSEDEFHRRRLAGEWDGIENCGMPLMVETAISIDREFHCDIVVFDSEVVFFALSSYLQPLLDDLTAMNGSHSILPGHPEYDPIRELALAGVRSLGLRSGVVHLELFKSGDSVLLGEIANRPGGGAIPKLIENQYGVDLWTAFLDCAVDRSPHLATRERPSIVVRVKLPARNGRILSITTEQEFLRQEGVLGAEIYFKSGDTFQDRLTSVFMTGVVFGQVATYEGVSMFVDKVSKTYRLQVEA